MTKFIPLFPLNIVVYPGEPLNLHIFEPRYKELVNECFDQNKDFGIATAFKSGLSEFGTTVSIVSVEKVHQDGEMDIRTIGQRVFKILEHIKEIPDKLYQGAIVSYQESRDEGIDSKMNLILKDLRYFHQLLEVKKDYKKLFLP